MEWHGKEKREFPRAKFPCKIIIYLPKEHALVTHTENIARGGVRVIIEELLSSSSVVGVEIFIKPSQPIKCKGRVIWQLQSANPLIQDSLLFDTGLEFMAIDEDDKKRLSEVLEEFIKGSQC